MATDFDPADLEGLDEVIDHETRKTYAPSRRQKIHSFTVACLIFNRTVGSGIFVTPGQILVATNSAGISLLFWLIGGLISICALLVWLEFGLSTPRRKVAENQVQCVPRSGGEKNYLEYALKSPKFLATCMFGIVFIILGNLSGNAIAFGEYVMLAAGYSDESDNLTASHSSVRGVAVSMLTVVILVHMATRRGGILLNDAFAIFKLLIFLVILIVGFSVRAGADFSKGSSLPKAGGSNFSTKTSFADMSKNLSNFATSFLYILYTFSGYEQPFYVLSEVHRPQRHFAKTTIITMIFVVCLFFLVNVAYLCVVPLEVVRQNPNLDIATLFFRTAFGTNAAKRVMQGAIALAIFGNVVVMTFTASRVKQEIAKEGILPFSLVFASGKTTPVSWLRARLSRRKPTDADAEAGAVQLRPPPEQSPMAALFLHWCSSLVLIAVTASLSPATAYSFLVQLYSYVMVVFIGFWTVTGLLYAKLVRRTWIATFAPFGGHAFSIIYWVATLFLLITAFLKPGAAFTQPYPYYLVPTIGISSILWGTSWWVGIKLIERWRGEVLKVERKPFIVQEEEDGEWVMKYEIIRHEWRALVAVNESDEEDEEQEELKH